MLVQSLSGFNFCSSQHSILAILFFTFFVEFLLVYMLTYMRNTNKF